MLAAVLKGRGVHWDGAMTLPTAPDITVRAERHQVEGLDRLSYVYSVHESLYPDSPLTPVTSNGFELGGE